MHSKRFLILSIGFVFLLSFLLIRLMYISVFKNSEYSEAVSMQQTNVLTISKARGNICDKNGVPITGTEKAYYGINTEGKMTSVNDGIVSFPVVSRYGKKSIASHVTGYVNGDGEGVCGVEKLCDESLKTDTDIKAVFKCDAIGRPFEDTDVVINTGIQNKSGEVWLTLDYEIQKIVEDVMDKNILKGAVVILDTETFEIRAMASRPDYDRNNPGDYFGRNDAPLLNRALCEYNAGSVFKIAVAAASLDNNMEYADRLFFCHGQMESENALVFGCNKADGHGLLDYRSAFAKSCNCAFYETGLCTGGNKVHQMAKKLGMGTTHLGIDNEEAKGNVPYAEKYTDSQIMNISIGQGDVMITPLQCAVMTATIANNGIRKPVRLISDLWPDEDGMTELSAEKNEIRVMESETATELGKMMRQCVVSGTGVGALECSVTVAGKTGSAETGWKNEDGSLLQHGWFCGFFPYENPKYAMAILCEDGKSGAGSCVKPFVEICDKINEFYLKNSRNWN